MLIPNQFIKTTWSNTNKKHYIEKGYVFTKVFDDLVVKVEDLPQGSRERVRVKCDYCGKEIEKEYANYNIESSKDNGKNCCYDCKDVKIKETYEKKKEEKIKEFEEICSKRGYISLAKISDYKTSTTPLPYICPIHGEKKISLSNIKKGRGCRQCGREIYKEKVKLTDAQVKEVIESKNNNEWINVGEYVNAITNNIVVKCGSCGKNFTVSVNNYNKNVTGKCPDCNVVSVGEYKIANILDELHINYVRQKRFDGCRDQRTLPFDFYLPDYNTCIEFDGQLHYLDVFGEEQLLTTQKHDTIKNEYCKDNRINLIRISYLDGDNLEEVLIKELKNIGYLEDIV